MELLEALGAADGPRALLAHGSNIVVSAPNAVHIREHLQSLDQLVVADFVPSETAQLADVVLPTTQWAEEDGTMTNLEGRVLRRRRAIAPPGGARSDLDIIASLASRQGYTEGFPTDPAMVFTELRAVSRGGPADYSGITWERLNDGEALYWPCPATDPGTPGMFLDGFPYGLVLAWNCAARAP